MATAGPEASAPHVGSDVDSRGGAAGLRPSTRNLAVAAVLNLPLVGLINGGPNFQTSLVHERGLSWEDAASAFDLGFSLSAYGGMLVCALAPPLRPTAVGSIAVELVGLFMLWFCRGVNQLTLGLGLVALGGTSLYLTSLRLVALSDSDFWGFLIASTFSASAYTSCLLLLPGFSLDLFCLLVAALATPAMGVVWCIYNAPQEGFRCPGGPSWRGASGFRECRYWAFCTYFGLISGGLVWATGAFDGTVAVSLGDLAWGAWLTDIFPLVYNAVFLWVPVFGLCVKYLGFCAPGIALAAVAQSLLLCMAWPSVATLCLGVLSASATNSLLFTLQVVYLTKTFPSEEFPMLLCGTLLTQSACLLLIPLWPKQGAWAAQAWLCTMCLAYVWPCAQYWSDRQAQACERNLSDSLVAAEPRASAASPATP